MMHREPLAADRGMLFQFPDVAERAFWMHNTPSSLDIIYIDPYGRIVSIAERVTPSRRAASAKLPVATTFVSTFIASSLSIGVGPQPQTSVLKFV